MIHLHFRSRLLASLILLAGFTAPVQAAVTGVILDDEVVAEADASSLKAEANLFARVKDGVILTLAECELTSECSPSVGAREVERIIQKIDTRITALVDRYSETNNKELEEALLIYADAREGYVKALDQLEALPGSGDQGLGEDSFGEDLQEGDFSDLFEDADEEL